MEYRKIKDYENYEVSENGDVRNIKTGRIMKLYLLILKLKFIIIPNISLDISLFC